MADPNFLSPILTYYSSSTWPDLLLPLAGIYTVYSLLRIFYNLRLHPLRSIPGPLLARSTSLFETYHTALLDGTLPHILPSLHATYGSVLRIAPNKLSFSTITAYNTIYHASSASQKFLKYRGFYGTLGLPHTLTFVIDPVVARKQRDVIAPALKREKVVKDHQGFVAATYSRLADRILEESAPAAGKAPESFNLYRAVRSASLDVVMHVVQGRDEDAVGRPKFSHDLLVLMEDTGKVHNLSVSFWVVRWVLQVVLPRVMKLFGVEFRILEEMMRRTGEMFKEAAGRVGEREDKGDGSLVMKMAKAGHEEIVVIQEAVGTIFAGTDGVGNALMPGLTHVILNPEIEKTLLQELTTIWPDASTPPPSLEELERLPYLSGVVRESFRLGSGLSGFLWREPVTDSFIDGIPVPKGTAVGIAATVMHTNPSIFPSPHTFNPERWLDKSDVSAHLQRQQAFVTFGKGQRMCAGRDLASAEVTMGMAILIRRLKIEIEQGMRGMSVEGLLKWRDHFGVFYPGRHVHVYARKREGEEER